jgi:hypothetical protein
VWRWCPQCGGKAVWILDDSANGGLAFVDLGVRTRGPARETAGPGRGGREAGKETETESRKRPSTGTTRAQRKLLPTDGPANDGDGKAIGGQLEVAQGAAKGVSPVKPPM